MFLYLASIHVFEFGKAQLSDIGITRLMYSLHRRLRRNLNLLAIRHFDLGTVQIITLHPVEASENEEPLIVENYSLVEGSRGRRDIKRDPSCPCLQLEIILMNIVKSLQSKVDAAEDIHGLLSGTRCMPISPLDIAMHLAWL